MIIKELKIHSFGKIKDKAIKFSDSLNVIYGKNESGKTTVMSFIRFMFYGGQGRVNDVKNYFPMDLSSPSGEMLVSYNQKDYHIIRNGAKKKGCYASITCLSDGEAASGENAENFLSEMLGMGEEMFVSTMFAKDISESTMLAKDEILERLENLSSSGDENVSYDKVMSELEEERLSLVSPRRKDAVIPALERELFDTEAELRRFSDIKDRCIEIEHEIKKAADEEEKLSKIASFADGDSLSDEVERYNDEYRKLNDEILSIENVCNIFFASVTRDDIESYKKKDRIAYNKVEYIICASLFVFCVSSLIFEFFSVTLTLLCAIISFLCVGYKINMRKSLRKIYLKGGAGDFWGFLHNYESFIANKAKINHFKQKQTELSAKIQFAGKSADEKKNILKANMENVFEINARKNRLQTEFESLSASLLKMEELTLKRTKIKESLEKYSECVKIIDDTKELISVSYEKLKKDFSPALSKIAGEIFDFVSRRGDEIVVSEKLSLSLKRDGGIYPVQNLSRSTLDLLYFSFRIASLKMMCGEKKMPMFLDESFIRYDAERLTSILKYLSESTGQVIMTTFSDYERRIIEQNKNYNLIEL